MNCSLPSIIQAEINVFSCNAFGCSFTYFSYTLRLGSPWVRLWRLVLACLSKLRLASAPNTSLHIARGTLWWPVQQAHRGLHQGHLVAITAVHIYTPRDRAVHQVTFSLNLLFTYKQAHRQPAGPLAVRAKVADCGEVVVFGDEVVADCGEVVVVGDGVVVLNDGVSLVVFGDEVVADCGEVVVFGDEVVADCGEVVVVGDGVVVLNDGVSLVVFGDEVVADCGEVVVFGDEVVADCGQVVVVGDGVVVLNDGVSLVVFGDEVVADCGEVVVFGDEVVADCGQVVVVGDGVV